MKKLAKAVKKAVKKTGAAVAVAQLEASPALPVAPEAVKAAVSPGLSIIETPSSAARQTSGRRVIAGLGELLEKAGLSRDELAEAHDGPMRAILAYFPDELGPRSKPGGKTRAALYACGHGGPGPRGLGELCYVKADGSLYVTKRWRCRRCRDGEAVSEANAKLLADVQAAREGNGGRIVLIRTGGPMKGSIPEGIPIS